MLVVRGPQPKSTNRLPPGTNRRLVPWYGSTVTCGQRARRGVTLPHGRVWADRGRPRDETVEPAISPSRHARVADGPSAGLDDKRLDVGPPAASSILVRERLSSQ